MLRRDNKEIKQMLLADTTIIARKQYFSYYKNVDPTPVIVALAELNKTDKEQMVLAVHNLALTVRLSNPAIDLRNALFDSRVIDCCIHYLSAYPQRLEQAFVELIEYQADSVYQKEFFLDKKWELPLNNPNNDNKVQQDKEKSKEKQVAEERKDEQHDSEKKKRSLFSWYLERSLTNPEELKKKIIFIVEKASVCAKDIIEQAGEQYPIITQTTAAIPLTEIRFAHKQKYLADIQAGIKLKQAEIDSKSKKRGHQNITATETFNKRAAITTTSASITTSITTNTTTTTTTTTTTENETENTTNKAINTNNMNPVIQQVFSDDSEAFDVFFGLIKQNPSLLNPNNNPVQILNLTTPPASQHKNVLPKQSIFAPLSPQTPSQVTEPNQIPVLSTIELQLLNELTQNQIYDLNNFMHDGDKSRFENLDLQKDFVELSNEDKLKFIGYLIFSTKWAKLHTNINALGKVQNIFNWLMGAPCTVQNKLDFIDTLLVKLLRNKDNKPMVLGCIGPNAYDPDNVTPLFIKYLQTAENEQEAIRRISEFTQMPQEVEDLKLKILERVCRKDPTASQDQQLLASKLLKYIQNKELTKYSTIRSARVKLGLTNKSENTPTPKAGGMASMVRTYRKDLTEQSRTGQFDPEMEQFIIPFNPPNKK